MNEQTPGQLLYALLNVEGRVLFISQIPDELTGVKRGEIFARYSSPLMHG